MKSAIYLTFLFFLGANSQTFPTIEEIHTRTGLDAMEEATGRLSVTIFPPENGSPCNVASLDEPGNTFLAGNVDAFWSDRITGCYGKMIVNGTIDQLTVQHTGSDSISLDWVRVLFSDGQKPRGSAQIGPKRANLASGDRVLVFTCGSAMGQMCSASAVLSADWDRPAGGAEFWRADLWGSFASFVGF